jgi:hypothetical protein
MPRILRELRQVAVFGRENRSLIRFRENPQELKLAERVGFFDRDFAKANECSGFALISRNRNDLASSKLRRRFRPFAGVCQFFHFDDTRNGTQRERLPRFLR